MDLQDLTPKSDTITITIRHPVTDEILRNPDKSEMTVTVWAPHTAEYKKISYKQLDKRLEDARKNKGDSLTAEAIEKGTIELLAGVTKEWNITFGGKVPPIKDAKKIYDELFWLRPQVDGGMQDYLDFTKD